MKRTSIKQGFGGEVAFTKFISEDRDTAERLLNSLNLSYEDGYTVTPEEHTNDSKRVDLVIRDTSEETILIVESQDASGWLDSIHASKITYYMYDKSCNDGVLICEDADEHIKGYVKFINDNSPFRITLLSVVMYENGKYPYCEFIPLIRPSELEASRSTASGISYETKQLKSEHVKRLATDNPGLFTNVASDYVSRNNIAGTGLNVAVSPYANGEDYFVQIWHNGKADTTAFKDSFTAVTDANGLEARFQKARAYVKVTSTDKALEAFKIFVAALENQEIVV